MSTAYYFDSAPFTTYGEFNPQPVFSTTSGGHTVTELQPSQSIRFSSNSSSVGIYSYYSTAAGRIYVLLQDGVQVGSATIPATGGGAYQVFNLATGLDTVSVHQYEILCITPKNGSPTSWYDAYLELDTGTLATVAHPNRFMWGMYGDSITGMSSAHETTIGSPLITDTRGGDMWQFCQANSLAMSISGTAGGKVVNTGRDSTANIPTGVDGVRVEYGINDAPDLPAGNATFQTAYADMVDNIRTRIGAGKPIVCLQPFPQNGASQRGTLATLIQAAISGKSDVYYTGTDDWCPTTSGYMPDGTHPNLAGYALLANRQIPIFAPTAITIVKPLGATLNTASQPYTVSIASGSTFTGDQAIVLTVSNATISAIAAGGSISGNGSGAVTVTPASGASSFTFTMTPSITGTITVVPTTTQSLWTMPESPAVLVTNLTAGKPPNSSASALIASF